MRIKRFIVLSLLLLFTIFATNFVLGEDKSAPGGVVPKLPRTANDPELFDGHVYPEWGTLCQRYTYSVAYRDKDGRPPQYVKIYFNGKMIDMTPILDKSTAGEDDYKRGVEYIYKYVPNKLGSNFYYFEASNGLGKARASIIDSPDNGPVLFESAFDKNEIILIDAKRGTIIWRYLTDEEWVGGVALSGDGQYLAASTNKHVYFFSTASKQPLWQYEFGESFPIGGGPRGNGIAISSDGAKIIASVGMRTVLFGQKNNQPIWEYQAPSLAVAISANGQYVAASSVRQGRGEAVNVLLLWETKSSRPLWEFTNNSNFHDVSLSADGEYLAASTGCPDRKAYIFSKNTNQPLVQSERLTYDSPVSKSKISADGSLAAFATEGGPASTLVTLFSKNSKTPLWQFDNQKRNSSRAMSMTVNGQFIAAATMRGDVYLLSSKNNIPLKNWSLNTSVGALDLTEDGSLIAVGGTDGEVRLLFVQEGEKKIPVNEFVQAIDIAANSKYVAAGTGGSVYFFEDYLTPNTNKIFPCTTIIEPPPLKQVMRDYYSGGKQTSSLPNDLATGKKLLPVLVEGLVLAGILLVVYWLLTRLIEKFSLTHPILAVITLPMAIMLWRINGYRFNFQTMTDFCAGAFSFWTILLSASFLIKIPQVLYLTGALFFAALGTITLTIHQPFFSFPTLIHLSEAIFGFGFISSFFRNKKRVIFLGVVVLVLFSAHLFYQSQGSAFFKRRGGEVAVPADKIPSQRQQEEISVPSGKAVCGNDICEPGLGETRENCPKDCSGGD